MSDGECQAENARFRRPSHLRPANSGNGNREQLRALLSRDSRRSLIRWAWTEHDSYHRRYAEASAADGDASWVRLRHPGAARQWLAAVEEHVRPS